MDLTLMVPLLVIALGGIFMYFVGAVIIQALRLSILQVKSDVKMKMDDHHLDLERKQVYLESKRLALQGQVQDSNTPQQTPKVTTLELSIDGEPQGLKEALESITWIRKFAIMGKSILLDIEGEHKPAEIIQEIEKSSNINVTEIHIAKNIDKTVVRNRGP